MAYNRIKELLAQQGKTSKEMAESIGISATGICIAISDKGNPSLKTLQKIAAFLGVSLSELFADPSVAKAKCPNCGALLDVNLKVSK